MGQTERVLRIQQMLQARRLVPIQIFLDELEVSPAQFKRDLALLRNRFQLPIEFDRQRRGYRLLKDSETAEIELPGPLYTAREIHALLLMQDLVCQLQPGLLDRDLQPLRERLKLLLDRKDLPSEETRRRIRILHMASRPVDPLIFREMSQATLLRRRVAIRYFTRTRGEWTTREISPQRVVYYRGNWYVDAWCHLRQDLRSFSLDAIEEAAISEQTAREVDTAALDAHLGSGYGIFSGRADLRAVLRFEPQAARWVLAERWHVKQVQAILPTGQLTLTVPYSSEPELVMDILRHGPDVEVIAPDSLREAVKKRLQAALARY